MNNTIIEIRFYAIVKDEIFEKKIFHNSYKMQVILNSGYNL